MRTLIHLLILALTLTASTSTNARALEATSHLAAAPLAQKLASGPSGPAAATDVGTAGLQLLEFRQEIGPSGSWTASGFVVLVHNACLVDYGADDLSRAVISARTSQGLLRSGRNGVAVEYLDDAGVKQILTGFSRGQHAERVVLGQLQSQGIGANRITRLFTELEPCSIPGGMCSSFIAKYYDNVAVTYSFEYGASRSSRVAGMKALRAALTKIRRAGQ